MGYFPREPKPALAAERPYFAGSAMSFPSKPAAMTLSPTRASEPAYPPNPFSGAAAASTCHLGAPVARSRAMMPPSWAMTVPSMFCATVPVNTLSRVTSGVPQFIPWTGVDQRALPVFGSSAVTLLKSEAPT